MAQYKKNGDLKVSEALSKYVMQIYGSSVHRNHTVTEGGNNSKEATYVPAPATATCSCVFHM